MWGSAELRTYLLSLLEDPVPSFEGDDQVASRLRARTVLREYGESVAQLPRRASWLAARNASDRSTMEMSSDTGSGEFALHRLARGMEPGD